MKKTICLNMIVKDEGAVIERCLVAIKPYIDSWCIVDTGSTDDTKEKIQSLLGDLPGELHERPWSDFGTNRTQALELAKPHGDFLLLSDASHIWKIADDFEFPDFSCDVYFAKIRNLSGWSWRLPVFISTQKPWFFKAKSHSALNCYEPHVRGNIENIEIENRADSARRRGANSTRKYENDVKIFLERLAEDPDDTRSVFYLAQSYKDSGDLKSALVWYQKCVAMNGWREERWYAHYQVGAMHERIASPVAIIERAYLDAYEFDPFRAEPLVALCTLFRSQKKYAKAYLYACGAKEVPYPADALFLVRDSVYEWMTLDEYAMSAHLIGKYEDAKAANETLLASGKLPERERPRVTRHLFESLVGLCVRFRGQRKYARAYLHACEAREIASDDSSYAWRALDEYAISAYWIGKYEEAKAANERLLANGKLPEREKPRVEKNLEYCLQKTEQAS